VFDMCWTSTHINGVHVSKQVHRYSYFVYFYFFLQARPLLRERNYPDLIDERIIDTHDYHQLFWMIRLAEKCLSRDPKKRLSMAAVSKQMLMT